MPFPAAMSHMVATAPNVGRDFESLVSQLREQHVKELQLLRDDLLRQSQESNRIAASVSTAAASVEFQQKEMSSLIIETHLDSAPRLPASAFPAPHFESTLQLPHPPAEPMPEASGSCEPRTVVFIGEEGGGEDAAEEEEEEGLEEAIERVLSQSLEKRRMDTSLSSFSLFGRLSTFTRPQMQREQGFFESDWYEFLLGALVLMNVLAIAVEFEYDGYLTGHKLGFPRMDSPPGEVWTESAAAAFYWLNVVFAVIFVADIILRVMFLRCVFFSSAANWLDLVVVLLATLELFDSTGLPINPGALRMLRLVKVVRAMRVLRLTRVMESLQWMLRCVKASLDVLLWSMCLLGVLQVIAGMIISQLAKPFLEDASISSEQRRQVFRYFGTFTKTTFTMFEIMFANWSPPARALLDNISDAYIGVIIVYRCVVGFAVLNIVNAVFVQQTMKVAQADHDFQVLQKQRQAEAYCTKLRAFFRTLDTSGDGLVSWQEFKVLLTDPKLKAWMSTLELEPYDLVHLFRMIDDGDGEISIDEFMDGAMRLRGLARSIDVAQNLACSHRMDVKLDAVLQGVAKAIGDDARNMHKMAMAQRSISDRIVNDISQFEVHPFRYSQPFPD
eukprot:TRINITY_DN103066_c0_g1_i1.p1 TRINITY_DN103066_c0_g1~~TRINITY_DN103066_c0_g1_i1.p1  ORF type:complete len:615 (+),score=126.19 TRINITY_DN103066_c0_g1_i1:63-1907(+)